MQYILNQFVRGKECPEIAGQTRGKPPVESLEGLVIVGCNASEEGYIVLVTTGHWYLLLVRCGHHLFLLAHMYALTGNPLCLDIMDCDVLYNGPVAL
jgi:hypothetical protein